MFSPNSARLTKYSVIRKLGIVAEACIVAASPRVVLLKLCGETATKYASAMAAISFSSKIPPTLQISGTISGSLAGVDSDFSWILHDLLCFV